MGWHASWLTLAILVGGCGRPGVDSADSSSRAALSPARWEPPASACELSNPVEVETAAGAAELASWLGPDNLTMMSLRSTPLYFGAQADVRCPIGTGDTTQATLEGPCEYTADVGASWTFVGRWDVYGSGNPETHAVAGLRMEDTILESAPHTLSADGVVSLIGGSLARDITVSASGWAGVPDGTWRARSVETYSDDAQSYRRDGTYATRGTDGTDRDWCVVAEAERYDGCEAEPWGGWVFAGTRAIVVTYDPNVACDGCGAVTIDGVEAEPLCGGYVPMAGLLGR